MRNNNSLSGSEKDEMKRQLRHMENVDMNGSWWHEWRGPISVILGLAAASVKFVVELEATTGGVFVEYKFGLMSLKAAAGGVKASALLTAAGPAVLLGVGVAAAAYFVPWDKVFSWVKSFFSWIWDRICNLWESFKTWVSGQVENSEAYRRNSRGRRSVPMAFS
ncbi:hypothetical protein CLAIMM_06241 [Cladophialophora immunda]|nr:hypothetical protein CLAIMM_06241 [Cladophialophora immunda]